MDIFIARQPIFDRQKKLFAYELLYRQGQENMFPPEADHDDATQALLAHLLFNIGLENITGSYKALLNFTENHLLQKTPIQLPPEQCIIEILETIAPGPKIVEACQDLAEKGYTLALDDYAFTPESMVLLPYVHIVKVDFQIIDVTTLGEHLKNCQQYTHLSWLAEKVETYEEFELARNLGFRYFQGFFFSKPEILKKRVVESSKLILFDLLAEICRLEIDIAKIERLIATDASLSYKLLRYINSVYFALNRKVTSIRYALNYLGSYGTRQFIALAAASELAEGKPGELMRLSLVRAHFCQLVASLDKANQNTTSMCFLLGLLSLLDAIVGMPMHKLIANLPLTEDIKCALCTEKGPLTAYLQIVVSYEQGDFKTCATLVNTQQLDPVHIIDAYFQALAMADQLLPRA